mgnify:CR=1 FL=1
MEHTQHINTHSNQHHSGHSINFKSSFQTAWEIIKKHWTSLLGVTVLTFVVQLPLFLIDLYWQSRIDELGTAFNMSGADMFVYFAFRLLYFFVSFVIAYNIVRIYLKISHGHNFSFSDVVSMPTKNTWTYLVVSILFGILVVIGFILLIIPGIYFLLRYHFAPTLVVDKGMGVMEAFRKSSEMTLNRKWQLLGIYLTMFFVCIGILILGLICLLIGVIPALFIVSWLGTFIMLDLYKKLL